MNKPNYKNGSIVNLMASIKCAFGGKSEYEPLGGFNISANSKNIVLIIIDGLGYDFLNKYGKDSYLSRHLLKKITSVFPAGTASAMTSFATGLAPQQHGLTGWFMYLKEIGLTSKILQFSSRSGNFDLSKGKIKLSNICAAKSFFSDLRAVSTSIRHKDYFNSNYSRVSSAGAKIVPFSNIYDFFVQINKALNQKNKRNFVFAYWAKLDTLCHDFGTNSEKTTKHFHELDSKIQKFALSTKNKDTTIIICADHGLIDTPKNRVINLEDHPKLAETLAMPLAGEARAAFCYVKPEKINQFENYTKNQLGKFCEMHKSKDLIENGYFGLFEPNTKLQERIGDYVLIMKENYAIKDSVLGEKKENLIGNHGGTSDEEMFVPLIMISP